MMRYRQALRAALTATATVVLVAGCAMMPGQSGMSSVSNVVTLKTQMRGVNEVPAVATSGSGQVDAVFNKDTNVLRWQLSYDGLSGPALAGHFHGPAVEGVNAGVAVPFIGGVTNPMSGQATLTAVQVADLMAGKWYANIHTAKFPNGEIRGQMTVRP